METPFLDRLIEDLQNHIKAIESGNWLLSRLSVDIHEIKKELAEYEAIKKALSTSVVSYCECCEGTDM